MMFRYMAAAVFPVLSRSLVTTRLLVPRSAAALAGTTLRRGMASSTSEAEKHLEDEMAKSWWDLKLKEKELEENPSAADALQLAEEVLEMALTYTHTKELIEESHLQSAHQAVEHAVDMEKALEQAEKEANQDINEAEQYLTDHPTERLVDSADKRRQTLVADISHRVENYVESRLHEARMAEAKARAAEQEAMEKVEELHRREDDLKKTLDQLKRFKLREETSL